MIDESSLTERSALSPTLLARDMTCLSFFTALIVSVGAFNVHPPIVVRTVHRRTTTLVAQQRQCSRRDLIAGVATILVVASPLGANAVDTNDLTRLKKGLDGVQYLLDNWDKETVDPNSGNDSPDRVRYYLGLRTTDHPLFQVDKLLAKAQSALPDDADIEQWIEAVEGLNSHIAKVNELAYTSSFGEYNPGGGKGQIRKYLLLCKDEVVLTRDSLKTMIDILKL